MGSEATWNVFAKCGESFKYFLPMCGDCWAVKVKGGQEYSKQTVEYLISMIKNMNLQANDYKIFACVGDEDVAYEPMNAMLNEMKLNKEYFIFGENFSEGNVIYHIEPKGIHIYDYCCKYIYKALLHFFK